MASLGTDGQVRARHGPARYSKARVFKDIGDEKMQPELISYRGAVLVNAITLDLLCWIGILSLIF